MPATLLPAARQDHLATLENSPLKERLGAAGPRDPGPLRVRNRNNARITGNLWVPAAGGRRPGIVITTGSIQGYEEMYLWAAQGLAEAGYVVMTYDVQGQGQSETFGHNEDGSLWCNTEGCPGVPFQQDANFVEGTEDALDWFLSKRNPLRGRVNEKRIGLAGHSLGATAVTGVGNRDPRVDAVVAWDNASLSDNLEPRVPTMGPERRLLLQSNPGDVCPGSGFEERDLPEVRESRDRHDADRATRVDPPRVDLRSLHPACILGGRARRDVLPPGRSTARRTG